MSKTGLVAIATPAGDVIRVELMTRDNFDSFVIDLLAEGRTLDIDEDGPHGKCVAKVKDGRRPFTITYEPTPCLYEPTFTITEVTIKDILTKHPGHGQKLKTW